MMMRCIADPPAARTLENNGSSNDVRLRTKTRNSCGYGERSVKSPLKQPARSRTGTADFIIFSR
jgi:hypothetical protein